MTKCGPLLRRLPFPTKQCCHMLLFVVSQQ